MSRSSQGSFLFRSSTGLLPQRIPNTFLTISLVKTITFLRVLYSRKLGSVCKAMKSINPLGILNGDTSKYDLNALFEAITARFSGLRPLARVSKRFVDRRFLDIHVFTLSSCTTSNTKKQNSLQQN